MHHNMLKHDMVRKGPWAFPEFSFLESGQLARGDKH